MSTKDVRLRCAFILYLALSLSLVLSLALCHPRLLLLRLSKWSSTAPIVKRIQSISLFLGLLFCILLFLFQIADFPHVLEVEIAPTPVGFISYAA